MKNKQDRRTILILVASAVALLIGYEVYQTVQARNTARAWDAIAYARFEMDTLSLAITDEMQTCADLHIEAEREACIMAFEQLKATAPAYVTGETPQRADYAVIAHLFAEGVLSAEWIMQTAWNYERNILPFASGNDTVGYEHLQFELAGQTVGIAGRPSKANEPFGRVMHLWGMADEDGPARVVVLNNRWDGDQVAMFTAGIELGRRDEGLSANALQNVVNQLGDKTVVRYIHKLPY